MFSVNEDEPSRKRSEWHSVDELFAKRRSYGGSCLLEGKIGNGSMNC